MTENTIDASAEQRGVIRPEESILPVTVKQILGLTQDSDSTLLIDGQKRKQASLAVKVIGKNEVDLTITEYKVTDYTGVIDIQIKENFGSVNDVEYNLGDYIYVIGTITRGKILAISILPITDPNQICFHYLQALLAHLQVTRGLPAGTMFSATASSSGPASKNTSESTEDREDRIRDAVVAFIKGQDSENGVSKAEIISNFETQFQADEITRAIESANFNGSIYVSEQDQDRYVAV